MAASLVALDPLAIEMSRIAKLDIFTATAGAMTILFVVLDGPGAPDRPEPKPRLLRPWRFAAGISAGAALATKWSGLLIVGVALVMTLANEFARDHGRGTGPRRTWAAGSIGSTLVHLMVVPGVVYLLSYVGRLGGDVVALPWAEGAWIREFLERQADMAAFHFGLDTTHPSASPAWSWLLAYRPVVLFHEPSDGGLVRQIIGLVNPLIWLPALAAAAVAMVTVIRKRAIGGPEFVVGLAVFGTYVPWLLLSTDRSQVFAYYLLPALPFLAVALGWAISRLPARTARALAGVLTAVALAVLVVWLPLIYGWPMSRAALRARTIIGECVESSDPASDPANLPMPVGWCWR